MCVFLFDALAAPAAAERLRPDQVMVHANARNKALTTAIERAKRALIGRQRQDGSWAGVVIMANRQTAFHVIVSNYIGYLDQPYYERALEWLMKNQSPDGTWGQMVSAQPPSLSNTAAGALALEVAGIPPQDPRLVRAREYVTNYGGLQAADPLVQLMYALYDRLDWDAPALVQFDVTALNAPDDSPASIRRSPAWWREAFVPLATLRALNSGKTLSLAERQGLRTAEEWLLAHQLSDGAWFAAFPTLFGIMAMHDLDPVRYRSHVLDGLRFLDTLQLPDGYQVPFQLSVWDTSIAILALRAAGQPACDFVYQSSVDWLVAAQTPGGLNMSELPPGGWSYNPHNLIYPDGDDTSLALAALTQVMGRNSHTEYRRRAAIARATQWLLYMQGGDGGWATFLKDDNQKNDAQLPTGIEDPSIPDITGHALTALGTLGYRVDDTRIQRAVAFLQRSQSERGSWYGRWGLSHLYGTSAALIGLHDVGADMQAPFVRKAVAWLRDQQNADGGWGEEFSTWDQRRGISYTKRSLKSTPEQTSWVLMALIATAQPLTDPSIVRAVDYLLAAQKPEGDWPGGSYTILGIDPYTNTLYATHWPLMGLGVYLRAVRGEKTDDQTPCATYTLAHQALPEQLPLEPMLGSPSDLVFSVTNDGQGQPRLWVENKSRYDVKNMAFSLVPDGASAENPQTWSSKALSAGSRLSWPITTPPGTNSLWNLHISYVDVTGRPFQLTQSLQLQGTYVATRFRPGALELLFVVVLLSAGLVSGFILRLIVRYHRPVALQLVPWRWKVHRI
jgi:squalene-hopene/tetraprenyl-beta-curcumene cyclase